MKTAEHLVRAIVRAMLSNPDLEPVIEIEAGVRTRVEIDARPFDPAPLIGSGGTMKFAIQTVLAGPFHPASWDVVFRTSGRLNASPYLSGKPASVDPLKSVIDAAVNHWRAYGRPAVGAVELSTTAAIAIVGLDDSLANAQRGAMSRLIRGIGKANGYRATAIVEKLNVPA